MADEYVVDVGGVLTEHEIRHAVRTANEKGYRTVTFTNVGVPEWPKQYLMPTGTEIDRPVYVSVIRADLGRELYEALKGCIGPIESEWGGADDLREIVARYEREVGDG